MVDGFIRVLDINGNKVCIGRKLPDDDYIEIKSCGKQHKVKLEMFLKEIAKLVKYHK